MALAEWLVEHRVALTGCDTWSFGAGAAGGPRRAVRRAADLNTRHGVVVLENLRLAEAGGRGRDRVPARAVSHAKLRGATGAWVAPLADRLTEEQHMTDHYDVIVIGSGAGGGTLTHALAPTGKRILLLERGDWMPREPENWDPAAVWRRRALPQLRPVDRRDTGKQFTPKQHYYVGGNTKVYGAILFRMRERDFGAVQHVDGVSPAWPISYEDFEPWYTGRAALPGARGARRRPDDPPSADAVPVPGDQPRAADRAAAPPTSPRAGLHPFPLPNGILLDENRAGAAPPASAARPATASRAWSTARPTRRSSASNRRCATRT